MDRHPPPKSHRLQRRRPLELLKDLEKAVGGRGAASVVAAYAKIAGGFRQAALWSVRLLAALVRTFLRKLRRKVVLLLLRQPDPLGDMLIALKRGQFGAGRERGSLALRLIPRLPATRDGG